MKTKDIKQTTAFKASPRAVFEALMDSEKHAAFTGAPADISREKGGRVRAYDGWIEAENVEIVQDKKIVQAWRGADWPKGSVSKATFAISKTPTGSKLVFTQTGVPIAFFDDISKGWQEHYWSKMKKFLEK